MIVNFYTGNQLRVSIPFREILYSNSNKGKIACQWINLYTPNVNYSWRTAPLTSKIAFYIFIQQI